MFWAVSWARSAMPTNPSSASAPRRKTASSSTRPPEPGGRADPREGLGGAGGGDGRGRAVGGVGDLVRPGVRLDRGGRAREVRNDARLERPPDDHRGGEHDRGEDDPAVDVEVVLVQP